MNINFDTNFENKIIEIYKLALSDITTQIEFYKKYDDLFDVCILRYKNNIIYLFKIIQPNYYLSFSKKWSKRFKKINKQIEDYNTLIGNLLIDSNPIYIDSYSNKYDDIIEKIAKKNNKLNRFLYGKPWEKKLYDKPLFYIKFNQINLSIGYNTYNELLSLSLNIEKQKTIIKIDDILDKYNDKISTPKKNKKQQTQNNTLTLDYILDKISKTGMNSLTDEEKLFLKRNSKDNIE